MGLTELFLTAVGLAMDAFAASVCKGLNMTKINYKHTAIIAAFFGGFQALMPLIGWFLGMRFADLIEAVDHWIAFVLLAFIGGKMIFEALKNEKINKENADSLRIKNLFVLAVATSIDALAVGITLAMLDNTPGIWLSIAVIGVVTFILSFAGVAIGNRFGAKYKKKAELAGGAILVCIGLKILIESLVAA